MNGSPKTWQLKRNAPVRADAEGMFVPSAELADATLGDVVVATGDAGGETRRGKVVEVVERDGEAFLRLAFDP